MEYCLPAEAGEGGECWSTGMMGIMTVHAIFF